MSSGNPAYDFIRRLMSDPAFAQSVVSDPDGALSSSGISDQDDLEVVKNVIRARMSSQAQTQLPAEMQKLNQDFMEEMTKKYQESARKTWGLIDQLKTALQNTGEQVDRGFDTTRIMYQVSFYMGVLLILISALFAIFRGTDLLATIFGGLGTADVIAFFITKPPEELERSRAELAALRMAMYSWFNDNYNWNALLNQQASFGPVSLDTMKSVSDAMVKSTHQSMVDIQALFGAAKTEADDGKGPAGSKGQPPETGAEPKSGRGQAKKGSQDSAQASP